MTTQAADRQPHPDFRPWYREPWVWLLIALPATAVIGCAITIWLALSRPDHLVMDQRQYQQLESDFRASEVTGATATPEQDTATAGQQDGDG